MLYKLLKINVNNLKIVLKNKSKSCKTEFTNVLVIHLMLTLNFSNICRTSKNTDWWAQHRCGVTAYERSLSAEVINTHLMEHTLFWSTSSVRWELTHTRWAKAKNVTDRQLKRLSCFRGRDSVWVVQLVTVMLGCSRVAENTLSKYTELNDAIHDSVYTRSRPDSRLTAAVWRAFLGQF